ncbi:MULTISPECIES: helix-turn-helix domain-containing protein [Methylobacterium]|uniref:helix-turn-helix domain-containing protein n=1 Tax=Methylobacterium TaxID=407 RepID=UPI000346C275|nr:MULTISPECIES: helix-turn-helix domain-containing protein [Methylobacterium]MBN4092637.1 helix-turn-helix domain-containing protein [Methylobacterium sp. OT2]UIN34919.1 helix-turn-helix domain-containing protein [Methylobacterium oryzae]
MQPFFSTEGIHPKDAFRRWRETICERLIPIDQQPLHGVPFQGRLDVTSIGPVPISKMAHTAMRTEATPDAIRRYGQPDRLYASMKLSGQDAIQQGDREAVFRTGDFVVIDARPAVCEADTGISLVIDLPRERFEAMLGPSRLYCALTVGADLASTTLANTFLQELVRMGDQLTPDAAVRMAAIGTDLIIASLAERMAQEVPRSVHGNVTVQRAKAYVEANLSDPNLDPPQLAAAMGVSLRRLQELFHERGRHISDYIWGRRLEAAAKRLNDPACAHLSIGMLAYGCGFSSQAHFARRFKDRYGMSPRDYRQAHSRDKQPGASASRPSFS